MIRLFTMSLILFMMMACESSAPAAVKEPITAAETQVAKNLIQGAFDHLWGGIDTSKISEFHTDDFYILEQGVVWTNTELRQYMERQAARENRDRRENRMEYLYVEKHGEALSIAYENYATFYQGDSLTGEAQWLESALAVPTPDGWRLRMMHSTGMPQ